MNAQPVAGSIYRVAVCKNCGEDIEYGFGWGHVDSLGGEKACEQRNV